MGGQQRRQFPPEFKADAVAALRRRLRHTADSLAAKQLSYSDTLISSAHKEKWA
jgi:transposase-like protein